LETVLIICSITSEVVLVKVGVVHYDTISDSGNDSETAKQDGDEQGVEENEEAVAEGCGQHAAVRVRWFDHRCKVNSDEFDRVRKRTGGSFLSQVAG
jgi:hypothetical protein